MSLAIIETLLEQKIGFSAETVGSEVVIKAVRSRMEVSGMSGDDEYLAYLQHSEQEWEELFEEVVIPETWFFRNNHSFSFLKQYVREEWLLKKGNLKLRVLSIPCSTGEEPYSIAMTLFDVGMSELTFHVDAVDLSTKALQKGEVGVYGRESFRGAETAAFRDRYFTRFDETGLYHIHPEIKRTVRFLRGNLLDKHLLANEQPYHVLFCRNLLIYLGDEAKRRVVGILVRLLADTGILFVGHAERPAFHSSNFTWIQQPGVFACRKVSVVPQTASLATKNASVLSSPQKAAEKMAFSAQSALPHGQVLKIPAFDRRKTIRQSREKETIQTRKKKTSVETPYMGIERRQVPDTLDRLLDSARLLADQGKLDEAFDLCDSVLHQRPTSVQANFLKGLISQALRNETQAEESFNRTVYLDPNHVDALHYLAFLAEHRNDVQKARLLRQRIDRIQKR